ncbi:MAG: hypothetical protein H7Z40_00520 [Phycisphaerae bacterium]|nr:hypothetical protein [Gemmatimonadaceae bacterium]
MSSEIRIGKEVSTFSGVRELRDGQLLISDAKRGNVLLVNPATGAASVLGSVGADSNQYAQPGGFYSGLGDTTLLLDRGQSRFLLISPTGAIITSRSIRRRGFSSSSSADRDLQRLDARGLAYFTETRQGPRVNPGVEVTDTAALLRFDAALQRSDTVALLRQARRRVTQSSGNMTTSQMMYGAPVDEWGVAPDGRIAVVRAMPYHVEWYGLDGTVVRGPAVPTDVIPFSRPERDSISNALTGSGGSASVGASDGASSNTAKAERWIAETKPPFATGGVIVSPDRRVWVARTLGLGVRDAIYDVFDSRGTRVDQVQLGAGSRVVGFGRNAVYAMEPDARGVVLLRKYQLN